MAVITPLSPSVDGGETASLFSLASSSDPSTKDLLEAALDEAVLKTRSDAGGVILAFSTRESARSAEACFVRGTLREPWRASSELRLLPTPERSLLESGVAVLSAPLVASEPGLGLLQVETKRGHYSPAQQRDFQEIAQTVGLLLQRLQMREHARRQKLDVYFVGQSDRLLQMERQIRRIARDSKRPVLISGERGSGKELAAYAIHYFGARRDRPFIPINSAALSDTLLLDDLFGHEQHAFTGAQTGREGIFKAAEGGTLFFDEIGDMPLPVQATLLRVLDQGELRRIGSDRPVRVDVRIVAATNKDLERMVEDGSFRADLYDRLSVFSLRVPPLRERREDIPLLFNLYLKQSCRENGRRQSLREDEICHLCRQVPSAACVAPDLYRELAQHEFPGNIRELKNLVFRLGSMVEDHDLRGDHVVSHLGGGMRPSSSRRDGREDLLLDAAIRGHIQRVLEMAGNNKSQAARLLGLPLTTLVNKMKRLGMS
jgi:DNA-binding NtrC family response regulator